MVIIIAIIIIVIFISSETIGGTGLNNNGAVDASLYVNFLVQMRMNERMIFDWMIDGWMNDVWMIYITNEMQSGDLVN